MRGDKQRTVCMYCGEPIPVIREIPREMQEAGWFRLNLVTCFYKCTCGAELPITIYAEQEVRL